MGRPPEGTKARETLIGVRLTPEERKQVDVQRHLHGGLSRANYFRMLVREDVERMKHGRS